MQSETTTGGVAIIGLACRFPGSRNADDFWKNLKNGVESLTFFSDRELRTAGIVPFLRKHPNYVKARPVLEGIEWFDAGFFGIERREAMMMDPQHRLLLECSWEALENAGYDPGRYPGRIGMYAGADRMSYALNNLLPSQDFLSMDSSFEYLIENEKDYLCTRISYKLNLKGPSVTVQCACSTSLVAVHLACESLLSGESDMALAGGVAVTVPMNQGYLAVKGVFAPDGHTRTFDRDADGIVLSNGAGVVVLKRLEDATADGDYIHAVIRGSAINNDGSAKAGFATPGVDGQAAVIAEALEVAGVSADTVGYVEAHGTGTALGDMIEVAALTKTFRLHTARKAFCPIGSVKTNIGHPTAAAGVSGLIKTVLALRNKMIPPSLNFRTPNPQIDFGNSPFYVNVTLQDWRRNGHPRRAGVSAFGVGGTNAHVIVEEAPEQRQSDASRMWYLALLSARNEAALNEMTRNLAVHLRGTPEIALGDVAFTLQAGRPQLKYRRAIVCSDIQDLIGILEQGHAWRAGVAELLQPKRNVTFLFPGLAAFYADTGRELYFGEAIFRKWIDQCCLWLKPMLGLDLRALLFPPASTAGIQTSELRAGVFLSDLQFVHAEAAMFAIEYALAQLLIAWGIAPRAVAGVGQGAYVAACIAGVMSLENALRIVVKRAQLIQDSGPGATLAVELPADQASAALAGGEGVECSGPFGPQLTLLSGTLEAISRVSRQFLKRGVQCHVLSPRYALSRSSAVPLENEIFRHLSGFELSPPQIPLLSCLTGDWVTPAEAVDRRFWSDQLSRKVQFESALRNLMKDEERTALEVGPGLGALGFDSAMGLGDWFVPTLLQPGKESERALLLRAIGRLWLRGVEVDWKAFYHGEKWHRVPLPTYPFQRERCWVDSISPLKQMARQLKLLVGSSFVKTPKGRESEPAM